MFSFKYYSLPDRTLIGVSYSPANLKKRERQTIKQINH